jgi:hypothetical protein
MYIHVMNIRNVFLLLSLALCAPLLAGAQSAPAPMTVPTTRILAMGHLTAGTDRAAIGPVMQQEIRDTVRLYLSGKIDQWYYRTDGKGVVFILNCTTPEEAHALLEKLPLGQHGYMEFDLIPMGPLAPLGLLAPPTPQAK